MVGPNQCNQFGPILMLFGPCSSKDQRRKTCAVSQDTASSPPPCSHKHQVWESRNGIVGEDWRRMSLDWVSSRRRGCSRCLSSGVGMEKRTFNSWRGELRVQTPPSVAEASRSISKPLLHRKQLASAQGVAEPITIAATAKAAGVRLSRSVLFHSRLCPWTCQTANHLPSRPPSPICQGT